MYPISPAQGLTAARFAHALKHRQDRDQKPSRNFDEAFFGTINKLLEQVDPIGEGGSPARAHDKHRPITVASPCTHSATTGGASGHGSITRVYRRRSNVPTL